MFQEFDRCQKTLKSDDLKVRLVEKQQAEKIFSRYRKTWRKLQTLFLEDLIST